MKYISSLTLILLSCCVLEHHDTVIEFTKGNVSKTGIYISANNESYIVFNQRGIEAGPLSRRSADASKVPTPGKPREFEDIVYFNAPINMYRQGDALCVSQKYDVAVWGVPIKMRKSSQVIKCASKRFEVSPCKTKGEQCFEVEISNRKFSKIDPPPKIVYSYIYQYKKGIIENVSYYTDGKHEKYTLRTDVGLFGIINSSDQHSQTR